MVSEWLARARSIAVPALAGAFALAVLWQVAGHELWRDEWHPWLVARYSDSLGELLWNKRYDGHPPLWYILVFALTRLTANPASMQWLHAAIAILAAWILLRFAPFSTLEKVLCLGGYYFLYEYAVIARDYGLCLLFTLAFCAAVRRTPPATGLAALTLALLAWSHALGTILAIILGGWWLLWRVPGRRTVGAPAPDHTPSPRILSAADSSPISIGSEQRQPRGWRGIAAGTFLAVSIAAATIDAAPPADSGVGSWRFDLEPQRMVGALGSFADALLPWPGWNFDWNSHSLDPTPAAKAAVGLALAGVAAFAVGGSRRHLLLWLGAAGSLLAFFYLRFGGTYRQHGFLWIATLAAAWLARDAGMVNRAAGRRAALVMLLALQVPAAAMAAVGDARRSFSSSQEAAAVIRSLGVADLPLVGETDLTTAGVAGALGRPIHFPRGERSDGFVLFDRARRAKPSDAQSIASARAVAAGSGSDAILITDQPLRRGRRLVERLATVPAGIVENEKFWIYRVLLNPPPPRARADPDRPLE